MNFNDTLKVMLTHSGIKGSQLAAALGYDTSYISRWLTGEKLPLYKKDLFERISEFIVNNSSPTELHEIAAELNLLVISKSQEEYRTVFEKTLQDSYFRQKGLQRKYNHTVPADENSIVIKEATGEPFYSLIAESVYAAISGSADTVEIMTTEQIVYTPQQGKNMITVLREVANKDHFIHVYHIIDRRSLQDVSACCRGLIHVLSVCDGLQYDVFISDKPSLCQTQLTILKGEVYLRRIIDSFVPHPYLLVSRDDWLISNAVLAFKEFIKDASPVVERREQPQVNMSRHLLNYMMQDRFGDIMNIMHPLYMDTEFYRELFNKYHEDAEGMDLVFGLRMCQARKKTVLLFKTALLDYLYYGRIIFLGEIHTLTPDERVRHLQQISRAISENPDFRLLILEDDNPMLCYSEMSCSLFLTERTAHAMYTSLKQDSVSFTINDTDVVNAFWKFMEELCELPAAFCMKGQELINYIDNAISWLSTQ